MSTLGDITAALSVVSSWAAARELSIPLLEGLGYVIMRQAPSAVEFFSPRKNCHLLSELISIYLEFTYITLCYLSSFTRNLDTLVVQKKAHVWG